MRTLPCLVLAALLLAACGPGPAYYLLPPTRAGRPPGLAGRQHRRRRHQPADLRRRARDRLADRARRPSTSPRPSLWADTPRRALTRHLAAALDARLGARVGTEPWPGFDAPGLRVEVIVDRLIGAARRRPRLRRPVRARLADQRHASPPSTASRSPSRRRAKAIPASSPPTPAPSTRSPTASPPASPAGRWRAEPRERSADSSWLPTETPLFRKLDHYLLRVSDLDEAVAFYRDRLGHALDWRDRDAAGFALPETDAELVVPLHIGPETDILVENVDEAFEAFLAAGGRPSTAVRYRHRAMRHPRPFGNVLVILDQSKRRRHVCGRRVVGVDEPARVIQPERPRRRQSARRAISAAPMVPSSR